MNPFPSLCCSFFKHFYYSATRHVFTLYTAEQQKKVLSIKFYMLSECYCFTNSILYSKCLFKTNHLALFFQVFKSCFQSFIKHPFGNISKLKQMDFEFLSVFHKQILFHVLYVLKWMGKQKIHKKSSTHILFIVFLGKLLRKYWNYTQFIRFVNIVLMILDIVSLMDLF